MKRYFLKVMYASCSSYQFGETKQSYSVVVEASTMDISSCGCYMLSDKDGLKAVYPINCTIIEEIDNI